MYRLYFFIVLAAFLASGCGSGGAGNENAGAPTENANAGNVSENPLAESDEEVPTFDDANAALEKGIEYLDDNEFAKAIDALKQAVELDEDLADAHFQLGVALSLRESAEEKLVPDEDEREEEKPSTKSKKPEKKESELAFESAIKAYKKMIAKDSKDHSAYYNLGRAYIKLFDDQEARKALEKAVKLNDEDSVYRTELGAVLIKLAQYPAAIKQLQKAMEIDEANYRAEDLLAKATAGKKRVDHVQKQKPKATTTSSAQSPGNSSSTENSATSRPRKVDDPKPVPPSKPDDKKAPPPSSSKKKTD